MSEQKAEKSGHETGSAGAGSADPKCSGPAIDQLMASEQEACNVESPTIVPDQDEAARAVDKIGDKASNLKPGTTKAEMPKAEPFTVEGFKGDAPKSDSGKSDFAKPDTANLDAAKTDTVKAAAMHPPRGMVIMSPGAHTWKPSEDHVESGNPAPKPDQDLPGRGRRFAAMAAMLLLAVMAGAAGGAFATIALSHPTETTAVAAADLATLQEALGRIDADNMALKAGLERTATEGLAQFNKTRDRLDRIEKAQTEPAAKLAKLSDTVEKLRAASGTSPAVATATPKDVTGTVTTPADAQALPTPQLHAPQSVAAAGTARTTEVGRLPTVESWVLRDAGRGSALIEGRSGLYEVVTGDPVPGLGRVEAIRKQDGRWVVVTSKGLIVAR